MQPGQHSRGEAGSHLDKHVQTRYPPPSLPLQNRRIPIQQNLVFDKTCATTAVYSPRPYVYCVIVLQDRAAECVQQSEVKKLGSSCP